MNERDYLGPSPNQITLLRGSARDLFSVGLSDQHVVVRQHIQPSRALQVAGEQGRRGSPTARAAWCRATSQLTVAKFTTHGVAKGTGCLTSVA
jgi:hypothetical protein